MRNEDRVKTVCVCWGGGEGTHRVMRNDRVKTNGGVLGGGGGAKVHIR